MGILANEEASLHIMKSQDFGWNCQQAIALLFLTGLLLPGSVSAQITPDTTLGTEASATTPRLINGIPSDQIDGGALRGRNLFHSFQEFNIGVGRGAYFANPVGVENILSRVTGNNPSNLLGTLGVLGNANLFLINPNGIVFGPNSRLDIRGSFTASTADRLVFDNGFAFSASNPQAPPLLTINVPLGLQYGTGRSGGLTNQGNLTIGQDLILSGDSVSSSGQLNAPNGTLMVQSMNGDVQVRQLTARTATLSAAQNLVLFESQLTTSGNLTLQADNSVIVRDSVAKPFIAQAGGMLTVQGDRTVDIFALNHPNSGLFASGDLVLRSVNPVIGDAHYWTGGNFRIEQMDGSLGQLSSPNDPIIRARGDVGIGSYIGASLHILSGGQVSINSIIITSADNTGNAIYAGHPDPTFSNLATVVLSDGSIRTIDGFREPTLDIRTGMDVNILGLPLPPAPGSTGQRIGDNFTVLTAPPGFPFPFIIPTASSRNITIGSIQVQAAGGQVLLSSRDRPNADPTLTGGAIQVSGIVTNGGNVAIDARTDLTIPVGIDTSSTTGNAGNVTLLAGGNLNTGVLLARSTIGTGGDIKLSAGNSITPADIETSGQLGGDIILNSPNSPLLLNNRLILSSSNSATAGTVGGNINLVAPTTILNQSAIISQTTGAARSGDLIITSPLGIQVNGRNPAANNFGGFLTRTDGSGNSGNIGIASVSGAVVLQDGAQISAITRNSGQAGNVSVNANQVSLQGGAGIYANTDGTGNAGTVTLTTPTVNLDRGFIFVNTFGDTGNAGRLIVNTNQFTAQNGSLISAASQGRGQGGNITLNAPNGSINFIGNDEVVLSPTNKLSSTALYLGATGNTNAGNLAITTGQLTVVNGAILNGSTGRESGGNAANVKINATEFVRIAGTTPSGTLSSQIASDTFGNGNAGTLQITTPDLFVQNGGQLSAGTTGTGQAGRLAVNASNVEVSDISPANQSSSRITFDSLGFGDAGELSITTQQLSVLNGGRISARTGGTGQGGIISINATGTVQVSGTAANGQASTIDFSSSGSGNARGIRLDTTGQLTLQDGGQVTVSGTGTGISGNIEVIADSIALINQGRIRATTSQSEGGNIFLRLSNPGVAIYMENNSEISAEAFRFANAGNLTIDSIGAIISRSLADNNDIVANAIFGRGGRINATASQILNFRQFQGRRTSESDFTSLSESPFPGVFPGEININTLDSPNTQTLPDDFLTQQMAVVCQPGTKPGQRSEFVMRGPGGIPTRPDDAMSSEAIAVGLATPMIPSGQRTDHFRGNFTQPLEIVEAQQLVKLPDGTIALVAPTAPVALPTLGCQTVP